MNYNASTPLSSPYINHDALNKQLLRVGIKQLDKQTKPHVYQTPVKMNNDAMSEHVSASHDFDIYPFYMR